MVAQFGKPRLCEAVVVLDGGLISFLHDAKVLISFVLGLVVVSEGTTQLVVVHVVLILRLPPEL